MPMFQARCKCGFEGDKFLHRGDDKTKYQPCPECMNRLEFVPSFGIGLTYFEEGRGRWIHNLGHEPVYITSPGQHRRECEKAGVAPASPKRGEKGCWA